MKKSQWEIALRAYHIAVPRSWRVCPICEAERPTRENIKSAQLRAAMDNEPMSEQPHHYECSHIGLTMDEPTVEEIHNNMGQHYFVATAQIGTIFGAEVHGELKGIGRTREQALERLKEETHKLHESLWAE